MSHFGYGSGGYLTRFEDYYKSSSDESDEDDEPQQNNLLSLGSRSNSNDVFTNNDHETQTTLFNPEQFYDSEDEEDAVFTPGFVEDYQSETVVQTSSEQQSVMEEVLIPSKDWTPMDLNDLKMTIKPPKNFKGYQEGAYPENVDAHLDDDDDDPDKVFSNDYADVCKFRCNLCDLDIDTEKIRSHINSNHDSSALADTELDSNRPYSVKTFHKCGVCGKTLLFTRIRLRYHIINDHNMSMQEYNDKFITRRVSRHVSRQRRFSGNTGDDGWDGGEGDVDPSTVQEEDISNDYADIVKIECKICNKNIEKDNFR